MGDAKASEPTLRLYPLMGPLFDLVMSSENGCNVECCGPDIFLIDGPSCAVWVRGAGPRSAREALAYLDGYIGDMEALRAGGYLGKIASVDGEFNATWTAAEWLAWFHRWRGALVAAIAIVAAEPASSRKRS